MMYVWLNDKIVREVDATVSVTDRGFLFGQGIFTTLKVEEGVPLYLEAHLKRLSQQCKVVDVPFPLIQRSMVEQVIHANEAESGIWRMKIVITASVLLITISPYELPSKKSLSLISYPGSVERPMSVIKSLSYYDNLFVKQYAIDRGYDDAILKTKEGILLETSCANIVWFFGNCVFTPCEKLPRLKGISLDIFLENALKIGFDIEYARTTEIPEKASVFITNSLVGFYPIKKIDNNKYPDDVNFVNKMTIAYNGKELKKKAKGI